MSNEDGLTDEEFRDFIAYFWREKGDPTRLAGWSEERCKRVWPYFLRAWNKYQKWDRILTTLAEQE